MGEPPFIIRLHAHELEAVLLASHPSNQRLGHFQRSRIVRQLNEQLADLTGRDGDLARDPTSSRRDIRDHAKPTGTLIGKRCRKIDAIPSMPASLPWDGRLMPRVPLACAETAVAEHARIGST